MESLRRVESGGSGAHDGAAANSQEGAPDPAAVWVAIDSLEPWPDNPRVNDEAAEKLVAFLGGHGGERAWTSPIAAQAGSRRIIAGHTRLKAARLLCKTRVPARFLEVDDEGATVLALADNKLGEAADWDEIKPIMLPEDALRLSGFELEGQATHTPGCESTIAYERFVSSCPSRLHGGQEMLVGKV